jgi:uncharacterized protein YigE (DUF2233 family)
LNNSDSTNNQTQRIVINYASLPIVYYRIITDFTLPAARFVTSAYIEQFLVESLEHPVLEHALAQPAHGQHSTSNELRKLGISVSGSGVRSIWLKHNLVNFKNCLKTFEDTIAAADILLNEEQIAALEQKKSIMK